MIYRVFLILYFYLFFYIYFTMQRRKKTIVIGFLGTTVDQGWRDDRWQRWRPTVSLCMQEDLQVDQLVLLHPSNQKRLAKLVDADIQQVSPQTAVDLIPFDFQDPWDFAEVYAALYDWVRQYPFDLDHNEYLLHITTGTHVAQICWFLLLEAQYLPARIVQTAPSGNRQPQGSFQLIDLDVSRYDALRSRLEAEQQDNWNQLKSTIATRNPAYNRLITDVEKVAVRSRAPILITGETGVGKSHLARQIVQLKQLRQNLTGRFIEVNCATLRGDSAMSALFGHVKGAFTGAVSARGGWLKSAEGGVLFLDEIGELGLDEQAMLLKAIEEKTFFPVGSDTEVHADFQLIAGTNQPLQAAVQRGRFRADLLARLNVWEFCLPPLRDRREDIEPNLQFELQRYGLEQGQAVRFQRDALQQYLRFALSDAARWSGNFRDLSSSLNRMATLSEQHRIQPDDVTAEISRLQQQWANEPNSSASTTAEPTMAEFDCVPTTVLETVDEFDRIQLAGVLRVCRQSRSLADAGRRLFAHSRQGKATTNDTDRLRKYLAKYGLSWGMLSEGGIKESHLDKKMTFRRA